MGGRRNCNLTDEFYLAFEQKYRGSRDEIKRRLSVYTPFLDSIYEATGVKRAIDVGCGRGEWLELVSEKGFEALGVDISERMVKTCRDKGLLAKKVDALKYLQETPSERLGVISAFHLVEHLPFPHVLTLVKEAHRCLAPGGLLIIETPNPENLQVGANSFYLDPTHIRPLPPLLLEFVADFFLFSRTKLLRLNERSSLHDGGEVGLIDVLSGPSPDYAIVAQKSGGAVSQPMNDAFAGSAGLTIEELAYRHDQRFVDRQRTFEHAGSHTEPAPIESALSEGGLERRDQQTAELTSAHSVKMAFSLRIRSFARDRAQELYWTVTRWLGLGYLHDGSLSQKGDLAAHSVVTPLSFEPHEVKLAYRRLLAIEKSSASERREEGLQGKVLPRLAYFSPLPPKRSGISHYSAQLIPALSKYYEVHAIVDSLPSEKPPIAGCYEMHDASWFVQHANSFDRLLYHMGNSEFHAYMLPLLEKFPGVVIMHDFFLGHLLGQVEHQGNDRCWSRALYRAHGYQPLLKMYANGDSTNVLKDFPANYVVFEQAQGVIVHNAFSNALTRRFYGREHETIVTIVPLLQSLPEKRDKKLARRALDIADEDFIVCSYGFLGENKLNHRLLDAWLGSSLTQDKQCRLIFVGEAFNNSYCDDLKMRIELEGNSRIAITGYIPEYDYENYLGAADIAVQLRGNSRGESSAAVLNCLAHGLPTVVCRHGAMNELPDECVIKVDDNFKDWELAAAIENIRTNQAAADAMGALARDYVAENLLPVRVASLYHSAIENYVKRAAPIVNVEILRETVAKIQRAGSGEELRIEYARELVDRSPVRAPARQLLVDISAIVRKDLRTGIQRVVRAQLLGLLANPPSGFNVEPIWLSNEGGQWSHRYARRYTCKLLGIPAEIFEDEVITARAGDIYFMPDHFSDGVLQAAEAGIYENLWDKGVLIAFTVYDILPVSHPEFFPAGADEAHKAWLRWIAKNADNLLCISKAVMDETTLWLEQNSPGSIPQITYLHLGADPEASAATKGLPVNAPSILKGLARRPTFVSVGTIEPRKGYLQMLAAFEELWSEGFDVNLVLVASEGWISLPDEERRTIPKIVNRLMSHPQSGRRLFWLTGVTDEYLEKLWDASNCLIVASENEGFGLPLVEAARRRIPILVRDIPVFREVAGDHATYFRGLDSSSLAKAIIDWLEAFRRGDYVKSEGLPWITWAEHVEQLKDILIRASSVRSMACNLDKTLSVDCDPRVSAPAAAPEISG